MTDPNALAPLHHISWQAPWLHDLRAIGASAHQRVLDGASVAQALGAQPHTPIRFVPQADLPAGTAYESFIFGTGGVPTRDNLHDFFNGLIWQHYPQTKRRLNQWQAQAIAAQGVGPVRGPLRDALTLLDESGALLQAPAPLWQALRARDWQRLFIDLRPLWTQARLQVFGHAVLEKLVYPRKSVVAHIYCAPTAMKSGVDVDAWLPGVLSPEHLATKPFTPLPLLGVPGWWPANENVCFYDDAAVFRSVCRPRLPGPASIPTA
ncbi:DUF3025 domain-containing protein [Simplicispira psychrophila]|uniref:DUF3025 domain-containing protein n=1 Tax=Simplicispira psychrophila TaxID=80882 RepID=UPI00056637C6|nr:DUF3025 domain-containing protein [Simplicispira psychrophila]